ncbi:MAG: peptidoglycan-binding domain-containing protein [Arenicellales bacterium]
MKFQKIALSLSLSTLLFTAGCTTLTGESNMSVGGTNKATAMPVANAAMSDDLANALARIEMAQADADSARAEADVAKAALAAASLNVASSGSELFPPNALPGHCYARVFIPATFTQQSEQVMVKEASSRLEVIQPEYETVTERQLTREASTRIEVIPAQYKTITEKVLVKAASTKLVSVPASFEQITEQVLDKPASTAWKRGSHYINSALQTRTDASTGEVMCLVETPATYKTITRTVQSTPPSVTEIPIPAEYKTVSKTVLVTPASTREVIVPAQYSSVQKLELVRPGQTREITIPAEYETITRRTQTSAESLEWREVLCDVNMTTQLVMELQRRLNTEGYFDSPVDGIYQQLTQNGVNRYAKNNGLPFGSNYIALEVANALSLSY